MQARSKKTPPHAAFDVATVAGLGAAHVRHQWPGRGSDRQQEEHGESEREQPVVAARVGDQEKGQTHPIRLECTAGPLLESHEAVMIKLGRPKSHLGIAHRYARTSR